MYTGPDYFSSLMLSVGQLSMGFSPGLHAFGQRIFFYAAAGRIVWLGYQFLFVPLDLGEAKYLFWKTAFLIVVGFHLITYYTATHPIFGVSVVGMVLNQMGEFVRLLDTRAVTTLVSALDELFKKFTPPGSRLEVLGNAIYFTLWGLFTLAKIAAMAIVSFGLIAQSVLFLLGPIFVSLFLVPRIERLFWSWSWALLQWSFLQVTAYAYLLVGVYLFTNLLSTSPPQLTSGLYVTYGTQLIVYAGTYVVGFLGIPALNASIFSGGGTFNTVQYLTRRPRWA